MIGYSGTGGSFRGLANYLENEQKMEFRETKNLPGIDRDMDIRLMEDTAELSNRIEQPVSHFSISYSPRDNPTKEQMIEDMNQVLDDLGLGDHQAVLVGHNDHEYQHVHAMVNRVHEDKNRAWNPWQDGKRIKESLKQIELDRGYEKVSAKDISKARAQASKGEIHWARRIGNKPIQDRANIREMFNKSTNWGDLENRLYSIGCQIKKRGGGAVIHDPATDQKMKLSRVGRKHSFGKLQDRFGEYDKYLKARKRAKGAEKIVSKHIDNKEIQKAFGKTARAQFGSKQAKKKAGKAFKKTLKETLKKGYQVKGAIKGFTALASSSNPIGTVASMGLKFAKGISKQLEQQRDRGMGR